VDHTLASDRGMQRHARLAHTHTHTHTLPLWISPDNRRGWRHRDDETSKPLIINGPLSREDWTQHTHTHTHSMKNQWRMCLVWMFGSLKSLWLSDYILLFTSALQEHMLSIWWWLKTKQERLVHPKVKILGQPI